VRLILRVVRAGEQRAVARTTALVWCGLDRVVAGRKFQGSVPENFSRDLSTHIIVGDDGLSLARDIPCATATAVFADIDGHGSNQTVVIPQPEPYALIEWIGEDGARQHKPLRNGETIIVAPGSERSLLVFCPDSTASLRVGSREEPRAFARAPRRRLPLAALNDLCQGEASAVSLVQREPYELTLLGFPIARLCTPSRWRFFPQGMAFRLDLAFERPVAALRLGGEDILTGRPVHLELAPDGLNIRDDALQAMARFEQRHDAAGHGYQLAIDRNAWPDGAWLLSLDVRFEGNGRWQGLRTMRQDVYALALCLRDGDPWHDFASGIPQETELDVFGRCHSALLRCYASECWKGPARIVRES
jgi:hypothetical protein